jgi:hypothetical protein
MDQFIEDEGMLVNGFASTDTLEKIDVEDGSKLRRTLVPS